ncbi:MAG: hypothetical protein RBT63_05415, partial [Bdellovibrionales bacterium]|nr:hypothetical protein [Bdellovibrionales bacterium]
MNLIQRGLLVRTILLTIGICVSALTASSFVFESQRDILYHSVIVLLSGLTASVLAWFWVIRPLGHFIRHDTESKFRTKIDVALKAMNFGIWEWNVEDDRVEWDTVVCRLFGREADQWR